MVYTVQADAPDVPLRALGALRSYLAVGDPLAQRVERDAEDGGGLPERERR